MCNSSFYLFAMTLTHGPFLASVAIYFSGSARFAAVSSATIFS
jgi:hypothetical protein